MIKRGYFYSGYGILEPGVRQDFDGFLVVKSFCSDPARAWSKARQDVADRMGVEKKKITLITLNRI